MNPQQQESIARTRRSIRDALGLIDDLHELARAETGHLALKSEPVDFNDLVRDIVEEYDAGTEAKGLSLTTTVAIDVPTIQTTRARVRQIASNLVSNAIKYTESGSAPSASREGVAVSVRQARSHALDCEQCATEAVGVMHVERRIELAGPRSDEQRARLADIANRCPVRQTFERGVHIEEVRR